MTEEEGSETYASIKTYRFLLQLVRANLWSASDNINLETYQNCIAEHFTFAMRTGLKLELTFDFFNQRTKELNTDPHTNLLRLFPCVAKH